MPEKRNDLQIAVDALKEIQRKAQSWVWDENYPLGGNEVWLEKLVSEALGKMGSGNEL